MSLIGSTIVHYCIQRSVYFIEFDVSIRGALFFSHNSSGVTLRFINRDCLLLRSE